MPTTDGHGVTRTKISRRSLTLVVFAALVWAGAIALHARDADPAGSLTILPDRVVLRGQGSHQQLLVEALDPRGAAVGPRTSACTFSSSNPNVATVDDKGVVTAVADGRAIVTARDGGQTVSTIVEVERAVAPYPLSFRNHVIPVLTRAGCNSGPCHGAASGKNGFKLTLRGYDPEADYLTLTRQATARRVNRVEPARSLMLLKPTQAVSHGGGRRFAPDRRSGQWFPRSRSHGATGIRLGLNSERGTLVTRRMERAAAPPRRPATRARPTARSRRRRRPAGRRGR